MLQKSPLFIICCIVTCILWFVVSFQVVMSLDTPTPNRFDEVMFKVLHFPSICFPFWESWDSRTAVMSLSAWRWYYDLGETIDWAFWGVGIVWLFRVGERWLMSKARRKHESVA
jgi:hypothetical protein